MPRILPFLVLACISTSLFAQEPAWPPAPGHTALNIWPHGAPGAQPNPAPEGNTTTTKDHVVAGKLVIRIGNVSAPTLTLYTPQGKNTGAAVVVFPGGAYRIVAIDLEGTEVCDWLNSHRRHLRLTQVPCARLRTVSQVFSRSSMPSGRSESYAPTPPSGTSTRTALVFWASPLALTLLPLSALTTINAFTIRSMTPTN
jgi:hypothetical protein